MLKSDKLKPFLPQLAILAGLYLITALVVWPDLGIGRDSSGSGPAQPKEMEYSLLFVVLFFPMLLRNMINAALSPLFPAVDRLKRVRKKLLCQDYRPLVSVIVPAWNEEVGIVHTMRSVMANPYQHKELIVVNDGSTDRTEEKILSFVSHRPDGSSIRYIRRENSGKAAALNNGLQCARGRIIITVDADSVMAPDAIERWVQRFRDPAVMSVAGNVKIGNSRRTIGLIQMIEYLWGD